MSKINKVLVIGSGPIIIGQAAEFDYAGTQACKSLREEGITTVLVNSNPATIMTDAGIADIVYVEPLTVEVVARIIERERPEGLLPTLGGQTGLNLAVELAETGILENAPTQHHFCDPMFSGQRENQAGEHLDQGVVELGTDQRWL